MKQILLIESSPRGKASASRKIAEHLVAQLQEKLGRSKVVTRDLSENPLPHVGAEEISAYFTQSSQATLRTLAALKTSDAVVAELFASDIVVIATPMWNFGLPSNLKAWIDHIVRAGKTFSFGPTGPKGLVSGKRTYVVISSGSVFSEGPFKTFDFVEPYLRTVLGFIGMTDVNVIRVEGLNDPKSQELALEKAREQTRIAV